MSTQPQPALVNSVVPSKRLHRLPAELVEKIRLAHAENISSLDIAARLGISRGSVNKVFRRLGLAPRVHVHKLSELREKIFLLHSQGLHSRAIEDQTSAKRRYIWRILRQKGLTPNPSPRMPQQPRPAQPKRQPRPVQPPQLDPILGRLHPTIRRRLEARAKLSHLQVEAAAAEILEVGLANFDDQKMSKIFSLPPSGECRSVPAIASPGERRTQASGKIKKTVLELLDQGTSVTAIAQRCGVSKSTVRRIFAARESRESAFV
jgi:AcrR family transcriptional regulator